MRTERANAKINLYLDIVGKRENGYHDLVSIMQTVSLCDQVTVDFLPAARTKITLSASGNSSMPTDCRNLAWRAADLFLRESGLCGEVHIFIEKYIPMAAGLAGGSSDAAAVLRGLNHLCGKPFSTETLCVLGAKLGADIPFCIVGGGSLVTGIGDVLQDIEPMPDCPLVVACMGEGVSTPWAYGKLDELHENFANIESTKDAHIPILQLMQERHLEEAGKRFFNLFEEVVPQEQPYVNRLKEEMVSGGAIRSMMSGSGPSVFGLFANETEAEAVCLRLREMGAAAFVCHPSAKYTD